MVEEQSGLGRDGLNGALRVSKLHVSRFKLFHIVI